MKRWWTEHEGYHWRRGNAAEANETVRRAFDGLERVEGAAKGADEATKEAICELRVALETATTVKTVERLGALIEAVLAGDADRFLAAEVGAADTLVAKDDVGDERWEMELAAAQETVRELMGQVAADEEMLAVTTNELMSRAGALIAQEAEQWLRGTG
jgi:hypothetical protein